MSSKSEPSTQLHQQGLHLIADFQSKCGLSQSARDLVQLIRHLELPHEILDLPLYPERHDEKKLLQKNPPSYPLPASPVSILSLNADFVPHVAETLPRAFFENRYIIGIWFWETEILPPHHARGFDFVDEVWVASGHICRALQKISPVPVRQFTHVVHPPQPEGRDLLPAFLQNNRFVFLFCYDFRSMAERKNPAGTAEAFIKAFPEPSPDGPLCVLKSNAGQPDNILEYFDLRRRFQNRPDIIFMDGYLPIAERDALMNRCNCYVSLHRAEGLGLTLLECMSLGKPCITTAYSGNMDFSTQDNSWLIPYRMIPVGPYKWPFERDHLWADPDLDAAAAAMREAVFNPEIWNAKSRNACHTAIHEHTPAASAASMKPLIEEAFRRTPRVKPGLTTPESAPETGATTQSSGRARAYEIIKKAKTLQKTARTKVKSMGGWRISPEFASGLESILEIQKLQLDAQSEILRELGQIKKRMANYNQFDFDHLLANQKLIAGLVSDSFERLSKPPSV